MGLNRIDFAIIALYLAGITLFGLRFRKKQRSLRDYFLAGRDIPWWAIALSIVAAETSTLTIISIPGLAYDTNLTFLQVIMGYVVGRVVISFVLLPHYFRGDLYTAYEFIERRFGRGLRSLTAGLISPHPRRRRRGARLCRIDRGIDRASAPGNLLHRDHHRIDAHLYLRGRPRRRHLDRRRADRNLCRRNAGRARHDPASRPRRMARDPRCRRRRRQTAIFDFRPSFCIPYTFWAGVIGGTFFHYRQPRHRSADRAAPAGGARAETIGDGSAF